MKEFAIFDFDGTIADTSPGIVNSVRYTQEKMKLPEITYEQMLSHVGPPMEESYAKNFGLSGERLKEAVNYHKEYAMKRGYREVKVYDGIPELLRALKEKGFNTAVATLKAQSTAEKILKEFFLDSFFDFVIGTDINRPVSKAVMLQLCMERLQHKESETVLIGDSHYDADAATEAGIDFVALTYGFGYKSEFEAEESGCVCVCNTVKELMKYFSIRDKL